MSGAVDSAELQGKNNGGHRYAATTIQAGGFPRVRRTTLSIAETLQVGQADYTSPRAVYIQIIQPCLFQRSKSSHSLIPISLVTTQSEPPRSSSAQPMETARFPPDTHGLQRTGIILIYSVHQPAAVLCHIPDHRISKCQTNKASSPTPYSSIFLQAFKFPVAGRAH